MQINGVTKALVSIDTFSAVFNWNCRKLQINVGTCDKKLFSNPESNNTFNLISLLFLSLTTYTSAACSKISTQSQQ